MSQKSAQAFLPFRFHPATSPVWQKSPSFHADANGLADATGLVTAFAHHGSLLDAATGLQHKGERWYSPDLGRFSTEDPIQKASNWYTFAGNDPVNFAHPSAPGLSQQGHSLNGDTLNSASHPAK